MSHRSIFTLRFSSLETFRCISHLSIFVFLHLSHLNQLSPSYVTLIADYYIYHSSVSPARKIPFVYHTCPVLILSFCYILHYFITPVIFVPLLVLLAKSPNCCIVLLFIYRTVYQDTHISHLALCFHSNISLCEQLHSPNTLGVTWLLVYHTYILLFVNMNSKYSANGVRYKN